DDAGQDGPAYPVPARCRPQEAGERRDMPVLGVELARHPEHFPLRGEERGNVLRRLKQRRALRLKPAVRVVDKGDGGRGPPGDVVQELVDSVARGLGHRTPPTALLRRSM